MKKLIPNIEIYSYDRPTEVYSISSFKNEQDFVAFAFTEADIGIDYYNNAPRYFVVIKYTNWWFRVTEHLLRERKFNELWRV